MFFFFIKTKKKVQHWKTNKNIRSVSRWKQECSLKDFKESDIKSRCCGGGFQQHVGGAILRDYRVTSAWPSVICLPHALIFIPSSTALVYMKLLMIWGPTSRTLDSLIYLNNISLFFFLLRPISHLTHTHNCPLSVELYIFFFWDCLIFAREVDLKLM